MRIDGMPGLALGPEGIVEVGAISDARLSALAPRRVRAGSWWSAAGPAAPVGTAPGCGHDDEPAPERLALVRHVLHEATTVVTWTDGVRRGAFVVAGDVVLLDVLAGGLHHLTLAGLAAATAVLVIGLDPHDLARHAVPSPVPAVAVRRADGGPGSEGGRRTSTVHVVRVTTGPPAGELVLTVVGGDHGLELVRALPDGRTARRPVDRDAVIAVAVALLTGPSEEVAA